MHALPQAGHDRARPVVGGRPVAAAGEGLDLLWGREAWRCDAFLERACAKEDHPSRPAIGFRLGYRPFAAPRVTCSPAALTDQAAGIRWGSPPSFQVAATSSGVR